LTTVTRTLYRVLVENEEDHGCGDLPDDSCQEVPENAAKLVGAFTLTKLGDRIVNPKTVLTWLLTGLGAPVWIISMLVPVREAGSLIPQTALVPFVRHQPIRKWAWVVGSCGQALMVLLMAFAAGTMTGISAGLMVLGALAVFALFRSVASISSKDVLGKTVPKGKRGSVTGIAASLAGGATIAVGLLIAFLGGESISNSMLAMLLLGAAAAWVLAAGIFSTASEQRGEHDQSIDASSIVDAVGELRADPEFRRFVIVRTLLFVTALSPPFVVSMASRVSGTLAGLGPFVIASGIASLIGSPVWGRLSDRSSRTVMMVAAAAGAAIVFGFLLLEGSGLSEAGWLYVGAYFLLATAHAGARMGRKVYVVDLAKGNERTNYVAVSNTVIGFLLLGTGGLGALASQWGPEWALGMLALMGIGGALLARTLPEVSDPATG